MPGGRYPWAVRAGGPLLSGGGGLPTLFDWNPEIAQALPATASFTRASIAQVLTTTDGTTFWYQEAQSGEARLSGLRRVQNFVTIQDLSTWDFLNGATFVALRSGVGLNGEDAYECDLGTSTAGQLRLSNGVPDSIDDKIRGMNVYVRKISGTGSSIRLRIGSTAGLSLDIPITTAFQRVQFSGARTANTGGDLRLLHALDDTDDIVVQFYSVDVQVVQNADDPVGEWADPAIEYLNIGANGVRYFNTNNGNTVDANGVITEAAGTTITGGRFLREPAATNDLLHSNDMTQAAWISAGAVVPTDLGVTDIGGRTTQVAGLGALGVDDISQSVAGFTASGPIAPSVLLQRVSATGTLRIINAAGGAANGEWQVDLSLIGAGWVRLKPGASVAGFSEVTPWVADGSGNGGITYHASAGGPLTVNLSFNKAEDTEFATSPIITLNGTVTRVSDSLTDVDWPVESSAVLDVTVDDAIVLPALGMTMLGFGSGAARIFAVDAPQVLRLFNGGINSFTVPATSYEGERHSYGMSLAINAGIVVDDESNNNTDPTGTPGQGTIHIGSDSILDGQPCEIHRVRIYDETQTIAELEALF